MSRIPWMVLGLAGCGVLGGERPPEGTWDGACDVVYKIVGMDDLSLTLDLQLDVTLRHGEVGAEWYTASTGQSPARSYLYGGTWEDPLLTLTSDYDGLALTMDSAGTSLTGLYTQPGQDVTADGDCTLVPIPE